MRNVRRKKVLLAVCIGVSVLSLCGYLVLHDGQGRKPAGPPEKITIAAVQAHFPALIFIAQANHYFRDEGLDVTVQLHPTGVSALDALFTGKADLTVTAETPIMFEITRGRRLMMLAETFISDRELAIVARRDRGIASPSDLKGKRIVVSPGTIREYFLYTYLGINGISPNEVFIVRLPSLEHLDVLLSGRADAVSAWNPQTKKLQKELGDRSVTFTMTPPHSIIAVLSSRPDLPAQKPDKVKGILRALIRAEDFVRERPQESLKIVSDVIGMDPEHLGELWSAEDFKVTLGQSLVLALEDESEWAIKYGLTSAKKVPNYLDYIYFDGLKSVKPEAVRILM